jgi:phosphate transport system substrate-binding protein
MIKTVLLFLACALCISAPAASSAAPAQADGELRIWASPVDGPLLEQLARGFEARHPAMRVAVTLHGPDSTMAGVVSGVADLALLAREMRQPVERMAFEWVYHHPALSIEVANAGLSADRLSASLAVMVHRDNPLAGLTIAQLDAIFGAEHRRGSRNIRTWGELGLDGAWKDRPIHVYGPPVDSTDAMFIRAKVLKDSYKWNADYIELERGPQLAAALAQDPAAIAFLPMRDKTAQLKPLALAQADGGPFVALSDASAAARSYPLYRVVTMVLNREPGQPLDPRAAAFLHYVLGAEGQAIIARNGAYLPLAEAQSSAQLARLK